MNYDEKPEARSKIKKVLLDITEDLIHTGARYSTLQTRVTELQKKIKRNNLILTKVDKGNIIVVMDKCDYVKNKESYIMEHG